LQLIILLLHESFSPPSLLPSCPKLTYKGRLSQYFCGNEYLILLYQNGRRVEKYRGMGSLEAMTKGSDARYLGDTAMLKIAQGVVGACYKPMCFDLLIFTFGCIY
jgi:hypothetical protein